MLKAMRGPKKRAVDPNAPPRPNLLSHDKVIRGMTADVGTTRNIVQQQQAEITMLKSKLNQALYRIDTMAAYLRNNR
jgi:hypothetical protein